MVSRFVVRCRTCDAHLLLRVQLAALLDPDDPAQRQPFLFACPVCRTGLHGQVLASERSPGLQSDDFVVLDSDSAGDELVVTVATDVPVHRSLSGGTAAEVLLTPYIYASSAIGMDATAPLMQRIGSIRGMHEAAFSDVRRGMMAYANHDHPNAIRAMAAALGAAGPIRPDVDIPGLVSAVLTTFYDPVGGSSQVQAATSELAAVIHAARTADAAATTALIAEIAGSEFREHRRRVIDVAMACLGDVEALFPPMWVEVMEGRVDLSEFRVMRDDFPILKGRFQDVFELASRSLAFLARFSNIARRGNASSHVDGENRTLKVALNKTTSFKREAWLPEFPAAKALYDRVNRRTRNDIGHALVRYDFDAGALIYDDGTIENYLEFLTDYLDAVRLTQYLVLAVVQIDAL